MVFRRYSEKDQRKTLEDVEHALRELKYCRRHSSDNIKPLDDFEGIGSESRTVFFGNVQVLEFPIVIGDNPSVTEGCPLTIGWQMQRKTSYDVDSYEILRPPNERRSGKQLRIPSDKRTQILLEQGHSPEEIAWTTLETLKIKDSRELRIKNQKFDRFYEAIVMTGHKVKKVASLANLASFASPENNRRRSSLNMISLKGYGQQLMLAPEDLSKNTKSAVSA